MEKNSPTNSLILFNKRSNNLYYVLHIYQQTVFPFILRFIKYLKL